MNKKYERYIEYIVNDIEAPYFINMRDAYGLRPDEYEIVLPKIFNQPVIIRSNGVYNTNGKPIYYENSDGYWEKFEYNTNGKPIYYENSNGTWSKYEYNEQGKLNYYENSRGVIEDRR